MDNAHIRRGIEHYAVEISNIRHFFKSPKTMSQWQDWLWKRMPRLKAVTSGPKPPYTFRLGYWGTNKPKNAFDRAVLYTDLLTYLVQLGEIEKMQEKTGTVFRTPPEPAIDIPKPMPYKEELPY